MNKENKKSNVEFLTEWIGSVPSLILHTAFFAVSFLMGFFHIMAWETMLLILTTLVSLEAIYLSIFIQMTVNRHRKELEEVSEDVEDIQEDIQEISEDVEDIQEDVEESTAEENRENAQKQKQLHTLDKLTADVQRVLLDLEALKKR